MTCPNSFKNHFWIYYKFFNRKECMKCGKIEIIRTILTDELETNPLANNSTNKKEDNK